MACDRENAAVGRVSIARGARLVEGALLDEVCELARADPRDPVQLSLPIRIIVPSRSLREHLSIQLVERCNGAIAGVSIQTLHSLVLSILARACEPMPADESLFPVLIRQLARNEPALRASLQPLRDGYGAVEASVSDLLDAGFEPPHSDAVVEQIQEFAAGALAERARAVVRVAAAATEQQGLTGVGHRSSLVRRATQLLAAEPEGQRLLPARAVFAIGFADATGVQTDFIEMLVRQRAARVFIDFPPDPAEPQQLDPGCSFARRFVERLSSVSDMNPYAPDCDVEPTQIDVVRAPTCEIEIRKVAESVRALLDAGARAEQIGVIARSFDGYRAALRTHFGRLGVPFSGVGERGTMSPCGRRLTALLTLLREGDSTAAVDAAGELRGFIQDWPTRAPLAEHLECLRALVTEHLGWLEDTSEMEALGTVFDAPAPREFVLGREDFFINLEGQLACSLTDEIGGVGGGVAVLSAMEARSRTFEHLFLIGLSRNVFPRQISEDPLLRDTLRQRLRVILPDLPVKREGVAEERYLFAQFLSSSPRIVVSHALEGDDGRSSPASPFVARMRGGPPLTARSIWATESKEPEEQSLRPAHEYALLAGLHGSRDQFRDALELTLAPPRDGVAAAQSRSAATLARARVAVLSEADIRGELGPYFGFVGELREKADPRGAPLFVTVAEKVAACPWQVFVTRLLGVEAPPPAQGELPSADARLVGSLVHSVLHEIVAREVGDEPESLEDVMLRKPVSVAWPEIDTLEEILLRCAKRLLRKDGIATPGFARVLIEVARGHLEVARELHWPGPGSGAGVLGAEVDGVVRVGDYDGADRELRFRADRIDRVGDTLRIVDYKSGKPVSTLKKEDSRKKDFLKQVSRGGSLQAITYALAGARGGAEAALGEYLFLKPDLPDDVRVAAVAADDAEFVDAFTKSTQAVLAAWDRGSFFPRLFEGKTATEPRRCQNCEVKEACIRGDSGARRRLQNWIETPRSEAKGKPSAAEGALLGLWLTGEGTS